MAIEPVKVAVIGCGVISEAYLSTMTKKFKILDVVGCHDRMVERAQAKAEQHGIRAMTLKEILEDASIEVVVNLTTPMAHYSVVKECLLAGKHVYTEKPFTIELDEGAELLKIAKEKGLYLGSAPDTFLGSAVQTARYVVDSGMIGEISSFAAVMSRDSEIFSRAFPFTAKPGGGIGFDVGIYYLAALLNILGPVSEVSGIVKTRNPEREQFGLDTYGETYSIECENLMSGLLQFENGTVGNVLFEANSIFTMPERPYVALYGTKGVMYMADPNQFGGEVSVILKGNNEPVPVQQSHAFTEEYRGLGVAEMAWSIREGRSHRANAEMAYHALEVLHGMVKSGQTKANVQIESRFEKPRALPRGFNGQTYFEFIEEMSIAK